MTQPHSPPNSLPLGKVYLVGAGPGDPGMLTVRAAEILASAKVVLVDALVNPAVLRYVSPDCQTICVGKHGANRSWTQAEINQSLVDWAQKGLKVVRLKGGDPAVFARTAEELDRLVAENIPFEVVPGITAALAASSFAGIPITHRDWASSVAFVTSQAQAIDGGQEAEEAADWPSLARFPGTLVFYMGVASAKHWTQQLIKGGKLPTTPVAIIRKCSLPDQEVIRCLLEEVPQHLDHHDSHRAPVITIVGEVATLNPAFDWFSKRPLFGTSVLITRPIYQVDDLAAQLQELGAHVLYQPALKIEPAQDSTQLDATLRSLSAWQWVVFLSRNGVAYSLRRLWDLGLDTRQFAHSRIAAIGTGTQAELAAWRLRSDVCPPNASSSEALAEMLVPLVKDQAVLLLRANRGRDHLERALHGIASRVDVVTCYEQRDVVEPDPAIRDLLQQGGIGWTTVTSAAIAKNLAKMFGESLHKTKLISVSSEVSQTLRSLGYEAAVETSPSPTAMVQAILA